MKLSNRNTHGLPTFSEFPRLVSKWSRCGKARETKDNPPPPPRNRETDIDNGPLKPEKEEIFFRKFSKITDFL